MESEHIYTKEEAAELREKIISCEIVPTIKVIFDKYTQLQSAMLLVAQYWNDEAHDAVNYAMLYSVLSTPAWEMGIAYDDDPDPINLPGLPSLSGIYDSIEDLCTYESGEYSWEDNGNAVPTFAAYCKEGCHQEMDYLEAYTPYAVFRRKEAEIEIEVVENMLRPWLDGLRP